MTSTMTPTSPLWTRLQDVSVLWFESCSNTGAGWNGRGAGVVNVERPSEDVLIWRESGQWHQNGTRDIRFFNAFRWTLEDDYLSLEHLRFGDTHPVFLFRLEPLEEDHWHDVEPHLCRQDHYSAELRAEEFGIKLSWTVFGPTKDECINYIYW